MPDLNKVMLMGNLTRDPEVRYTPKGTAVGELGLAINSSYKTADGQTKDEVCYVDVVVWGRQAETCKEYLSKGRAVFIEGRLQLEQWESNGEKKSKLKVRGERVQFIGGNPGGARPAGTSTSSGAPARSEKAGAKAAPAPADPEMAGAAEDDIPF
jgi:single-strand DNA-binding protein